MDQNPIFESTRPIQSKNNFLKAYDKASKSAKEEYKSEEKVKKPNPINIYYVTSAA